MTSKDEEVPVVVGEPVLEQPVVDVKEVEEPLPQETAASPTKSYHHQKSISEAAESSGHGWSAPFWLNWIEYPFHVVDPKTGRKLPEAAGWAMDSVGRGPLNQVGSYVGAAILRLASKSVGCPNPSKCNYTTHGFKPSSLLTAITSFIGVISAVLMPIVGAVVDHSHHRRLLGIVSGFFAFGLIGAQIFISEDNWFGMLIIDAIQTFVFLVHTTVVFAYLPDLSLDQEVTSHYTSRFNLRQYIGQFVFVGLLVMTGQIRGTDKSVASTVQTARDGAGIAFGFGALFIGYAWTFLFRDRPALSEVPEGANLLTAGFIRLYHTSKKVTKEYNHLRWFMISLLFSPEAGAGVVLSIAVTFLTVYMKFSGQDIAIASLCLMVGNMIGSIFSKIVCRLVNPLNSYRLGMTSLGCSIGLSAFLFTGPERRNSVFGMAVLWGVCMGWTYPSQRVLFCTLIPKGQETEFMGLFVFVGQILGWLPSLLFTIINERGVDIRWGLGLIGLFCAVAVVLTLPMGSYEAARIKVNDDSQEKLKQILEATSNHMIPKSARGKSNTSGDSIPLEASTADPASIDDEPESAIGNSNVDKV